jgi:CDP-glucose 4,6-dehydratase
MPLAGQHPYDVSKSCADLITRAFAVTYGLPVAITRCGNFFGGGDLNWNRLIPGTIRSLIRDEPPRVRSNGRYIRDYVYVEDGVDACLCLAERLAVDRRLAGEAFNFSNGSHATALEVIGLISRLMGKPIQPEIRDEATNEIEIQTLNSAKARAVLGWQPRFSLEEGLGRTIPWYEQHFSIADRESQTLAG